MSSPIDLSPLDPARDAERWERLVQRVVARAQQAPSLVVQLSRWRRPVLALASAAALFSWLGAAFVPAGAERGTAALGSELAPGFTLSLWAESGASPSTKEMLELMAQVR
ncbi:MAG TPA: hypothetical protein VNN80_35815 [Polyangiaceae bacterium]|nr:hypothetical protein [Polyangiaceae bacterium]